jgi:hypothetical protein
MLNHPTKRFQQKCIFTLLNRFHREFDENGIPIPYTLETADVNLQNYFLQKHKRDVEIEKYETEIDLIRKKISLKTLSQSESLSLTGKQLANTVLKTTKTDLKYTDYNNRIRDLRRINTDEALYYEKYNRIWHKYQKSKNMPYTDLLKMTQLRKKQDESSKADLKRKPNNNGRQNSSQTSQQFVPISVEDDNDI